MALETTSTKHISALNVSNPTATDPVSEADDHLRFIKDCIKTTFSGVAGGTTNVTSTAAELNILDGCTATTTELNLMDGVTATTTELNYVDGVTSNVQTQLDAKAPIDSPTFTTTASSVTPSTGDNSTKIATTAFVQTTVTANTVDLVYPVDSIYMSVKNVNPQTYLSGTSWSAFGEGRVLIGAGTHSDGTESKTFASGGVSGNDTPDSGGKYNHQLTISEMPAHTHTYTDGHGSDGNVGDEPFEGQQEDSRTSGSTGGNSPHNNMQPYITVYMWKRDS